MARRLGMRQAGGGLHGRRAPEVQGPLRDIRLGVVVGKHLGLVPRHVGKTTLKCLRDPPVQIALPRLQDGLIGGVPNERMLEAVDCVRRLTALHDHIGLDEPFQGSRQQRALERHEGFQKFERELLSDDRRGERHILDRAKPIEPGNEAVLERRGDDEGRVRVLQMILSVTLLQSARTRALTG